MTRGGGDRAHLKRQLEERGHCGILGTNDWAVQLVYLQKKHQASTEARYNADTNTGVLGTALSTL